MAGKVTINTERCKGCGLCVVVCPKRIMVISRKSNRHGCFPAETDNRDCTGCAACALICPDAVIEVYRDEDTKIVETAATAKTSNPAVMQSKT